MIICNELIPKKLEFILNFFNGNDPYSNGKKLLLKFSDFSEINKGLKNKGLLIINHKRVAVKCTLETLPESITLEVSQLDTGDNILIRDIQFPAGVDCYLDPRVPVVGVIKAK